MSLSAAASFSFHASFPRMSGDEPGAEALTYKRTGLSLRERG